MIDIVTVIVARGIGETKGRGILSYVTRKLDPEKFRVFELDWTAGYGPVPEIMGKSFEDNLKLGIHDLNLMLMGIDGPVVLLGYSGGAQLMGDWTNQATVVQLSKIIGVCLIADPSMPNLGHNPAQRYGIRGERKLPGHLNKQWYAHRLDAIPLSFPDYPNVANPLRKLAKASANFSLGDRTSWMSAVLDLRGPSIWDRIRRPADLEWIAKAYEKAKYDLEGYLLRGDHTSYHKREIRPGVTYTDAAAIWISGLAINHS